MPCDRASSISSLSHEPFWFLDASLAIDKPKFAKNLDTLQRELERTKEEFIKEHTAKYGTTNFPPAWKMLELVSFGCLTKLYMNFADTPAKKRIARSFGVAKYEALESWMRAVNALRNSCAHHARVWNRTMTMIPMLPPAMRNPWINVNGIVQTSPYAIFCCIAYWLNGIDAQNSFAADLKALLAKYPTVSPSAMGFAQEIRTSVFERKSEQIVNPNKYPAIPTNRLVIDDKCSDFIYRPNAA